MTLDATAPRVLAAILFGSLSFGCGGPSPVSPSGTSSPPQASAPAACVRRERHRQRGGDDRGL